MQREIRLPLDKCQHLIEDGDVILFKMPSFPSVGWFVGKITGSQYSHVAIAEKTEKGINCIEYKEFAKSRIYSLTNYIKEGKIVDIYRSSQILSLPYLDSPPVINGHKPHIKYSNLYFTPGIRKKIVNEAKGLIGKNYGYINIIKIFLTLIPFIRFFTNKSDINITPKNMVCSTLVEYCYRKYWIELNSSISDSFVTPGDISNSSVLLYLFTISEI